MNRRQFLGAGATVGLGSLAGCTLEAATTSPRAAGPEIALEPVIDGLGVPTGMAFLPDGSHLVCERTGQVVRHTGDGLAEAPVLELGDRLDGIEEEKGLLGIALHPEFATNRTIYLRYSGARRDWMPADYSHTAVLSSFQVTADHTGVVPDSERIILEIAEPGAVHNAGDLAVGPDGNLYVPLGDGSRTDHGDDGWSWWYEKGQSAQNTEDNLLGGILRIDPDDSTDDRAYGIPADNPLVGEPGRDEYYAWGLRNPYRISFDDDRLFVADVGENTRESVYLVEAGDNCGWPILEGSSCSPPSSTGHDLADSPVNVFNPKTWLSQTNRISPYKLCPTPDDVPGSFTEPIAEYQRAGARSITGGYVYRGEAIPALQGAYLFGDFVPPAPLLAIEDPYGADRPAPIHELSIAGLEDGALQDALISFARDPNGELYLLTTAFGEGTGRVRRLVSAA